MSRERENRHNDPCLDKNVNTCRVLNKGEYHEYRGRAAKGAILSRLANWPKARMLTAEICEFYGEYLQYHEASDLDASHYQIKLQHEPIALQSVHIELQLGTTRIAEALMHELLHLHTRIRGYPIGEKFSVPYELTKYASTIIGIYPRIGNLLEHELILEMFLGLGFDKSNFLGCLSPPPDYKKLASTALNSSGYKEEIGFSWWCLEYFRHWVSTRHWVGDEPGIHADYALYWGSKVNPQLKITANKIRALIESGALTDIKNHHHHVNALLELMKIPIFREWATIQTSSDGKPVATPMTHEDWPVRDNLFPLTSAHYAGSIIRTPFHSDL